MNVDESTSRIVLPLPQSEDFRVPVPQSRLYWLAWQTYYDVLKRTLSKSSAPVERNPEKVLGNYERLYSLSNEENVKARDKRRDVFTVQNRLICTDGWFIIKTYTEVLLSVINQLGVSSVLEVGSGRGKNLALMALRKPEISFAGLEFAHLGVVNSVRLAEDLPPKFLSLAQCEEMTSPQEEALEKLRFYQASAFEMPFADKSFDFSFTCLVLEQMPHRYPEALREMRRVTRKYCAFIEPFKEANNFLGRAHLRTVDYFNASYKQFADFGLEPIFFSTALPQKLRFKAGLLIARVVD